MKRTVIALAVASVLLAGVAVGSSHREAPLIAKTPKVDNTDVYMFRSYEAGRAPYVTIIANFQPFQDPFGGPNYFLLDEDALYDINIDNDGDAVADHTFQFNFRRFNRNISIPVGNMIVPIPLSNIGRFDNSPAKLNQFQTYTVTTRREGQAPVLATNTLTGGTTFASPFDNIGPKSAPNYAAYADGYITPVGFDRCQANSKVFVGPREESFKVAVGEIFDLINLAPLGEMAAAAGSPAPKSHAAGGEANDLEYKTISTIAIEIPIACLRQGGDGSPILGVWSSAHLPNAGTQGYRQVSRLGMPLVNEVVIGLKDKDLFNSVDPTADAALASYVTNPTLPEIIQTLYPDVQAPNRFPRDDLVAVFLTGIAGLNQPPTVQASEMLRLNTSILPKSAVLQSSYGVLAGDTAGFPNGRRPGDDVVDIELRVAMGVLLPEADAPSGQLPFTDNVTIKATDFRNTFPYLNTPYPGTLDVTELPES